MQNVKVPAYNCVWATVNYDSLNYNANRFLRTADGGKTWRYDSVDAPAGWGLISLAPIDGNTCYAAMYNANVFLGGGIFKTINGGATWKQLEPGKLFGSTSFPEFVYFFDAQRGIAVGDNNGDTSILEIYTTMTQAKTGIVFQNETFLQLLDQLIVIPVVRMQFIKISFGLEDLIVTVIVIRIALTILVTTGNYFHYQR